MPLFLQRAVRAGDIIVIIDLMFRWRRRARGFATCHTAAAMPIDARASALRFQARQNDFIILAVSFISSWRRVECDAARGEKCCRFFSISLDKRICMKLTGMILLSGAKHVRIGSKKKYAKCGSLRRFAARTR